MSIIVTLTVCTEIRKLYDRAMMECVRLTTEIFSNHAVDMATDIVLVGCIDVSFLLFSFLFAFCLSRYHKIFEATTNNPNTFREIIECTKSV